MDRTPGASVFDLRAKGDRRRAVRLALTRRLPRRRIEESSSPAATHHSAPRTPNPDRRRRSSTTATAIKNDARVIAVFLGADGNSRAGHAGQPHRQLEQAVRQQGAVGEHRDHPGLRQTGKGGIVAA